MKTERRHDIDWLRVIAIFLLLIYHIAIIFQPWAMLIGFIRSEEPMEDLWKPMTMLNVWRIPLLFYVSGMGVYFAIQKRNWWQLLKERARRILLPFFFGIIAITPLHFLIFQINYKLPPAYFPHPGHLWFLGNIFVYVTLLCPLFFYLQKAREGRLQQAFSSFLSKPLGPLTISVFFMIEVVVLKPQMFELYAQTWHGFFYGLLAFLFGFLFVYCGRAFWQTALKWRWLYMGIAALLFLLRLTLFEMKSPGFLMAVESHCWILGVFGLGYKHLNKPSAVLTYLSQAAYPVYILHMFALYMGALIILPMQIPLLLKFIFIIVFTGSVCYFLYEVFIKRIGFLRPLFGLKVSKR